MDLNDLAKLAGLVQKVETPAAEPVAEQPAQKPTGREDMKAMMVLIDPEMLNNIQGEAPVDEDAYANSGDHYSGEPEEYKGTLGSPADLSLRRYLGANGDHVTVDETKVYEDHKVEDITEAYAQYKAEKNQVVTEGAGNCAHCGCEIGNPEPNCDCKEDCHSPVNEGATKSVIDMIANADNPSEMVMDLIDRDEAIGKFLYNELEQLATEAGKTFNNAESMPEDFVDELLANMGIEESVIDEADIEENAFNQAAAAAARAGKDTFEFGGKTHKTTMKKDVAHKLDDDIDALKQLAGL